VIEEKEKQNQLDEDLKREINDLPDERDRLYQAIDEMWLK